MEWAERNNLILKNVGEFPTCVRPQGVSVVDLTSATPRIANKIRNWMVEESDLSLLDHNYIRYLIKGSGRRAQVSGSVDKESRISTNKRWKMDTLEQDMFDEVLK